MDGVMHELLSLMFKITEIALPLLIMFGKLDYLSKTKLLQCEDISNGNWHVCKTKKKNNSCIDDLFCGE